MDPNLEPQTSHVSRPNYMVIGNQTRLLGLQTFAYSFLFIRALHFPFQINMICCCCCVYISRSIVNKALSPTALVDMKAVGVVVMTESAISFPLLGSR